MSSIKIKIKYFTMKIPIPYLSFEKGKKVPPVRVGDVVITEHGLDIGLVAEISQGKPVRVYSRYYGQGWHKEPCSEYGGAEHLDWYSIGINISLERWIEISCKTKDAQSFRQYWKNRSGKIA